MNNALHMLGIGRKAGKIEVGEEPVGACCRAGKAKLILVASDAADNSARRAAHFAEAGKAPWVRIPFTKGELGGILGRTSCAMAALTDVGIAAALVEKLVQTDVCYEPTYQLLRVQADKALQRQKEQRVHEKRMREKERRPWVAPPKREVKPKQTGRKAPEGKKPFAPKGAITIKKKAP